MTSGGRDALRAGPILQNRAMQNPKMKFIWNSVVKEIQGKDAVASLVCFQDARPLKSQYRRFKIRTVEGADDFARTQRIDVVAKNANNRVVAASPNVTIVHQECIGEILQPFPSVRVCRRYRLFAQVAARHDEHR